MLEYHFECQKCKAVFMRATGIEEFLAARIRCPQCQSEDLKDPRVPFIAKTADRSMVDYTLAGELRGREGSVNTMTVAQAMSPAPVVVRPEEGLRKVCRLMSEHRIRHLPVVSADGLVGVVSDRDVQEALPSPADPGGATEVAAAMDRIAAWQVMAEQVFTVTPHAPLAEAAQLLAERKIGCLPVMEKGRLVGIVTETDMLQALTMVLEKMSGSPQLEVTVADAPGRLCKVSRLFADLPPRVGVFVLARTEPTGPEGSGDRAIVLGFHQAFEPGEIVRLLEGAGIQVLSFKDPQTDRATRGESR